MSLNVRLRMKKFKSSLSRYWPTFALFALLLAIWQLTVSYAGIREYLLPAPLAVWNAMWHGEISWAQHLWFTTWEIIGAFLMAAVFGVLLGVGIAWSPLIANALVPFLVFVNTLPKHGVRTTLVDPAEPENFRRALNDRTKAIFIETIGNPDINIIDFEAVARIAEDHLRILRFFRFHARFGRGVMDKAGLAACRRQAKSLAKLSAERVHQELLKLLAAPGAVATLRIMQQEAPGLFSDFEVYVAPDRAEAARIGYHKI